MADLFNQQISATYSGLLKTSSSGVLSASLSQISDGRGNTSPLYLSTDSIQFYGAYSFPNADGSANQVLKTDGAGVLTWENDSLSNTLNFSGGTGTGSVTLDTQTLAFTGTANEIVTSASSQAITLSFPTTGVTLPNGSIATTQSPSDDSTKVATTAYVEAAVAAGVDVTKTGTITANQIAVWNDSTDELRSDETVTIGTDHSITLSQPNSASNDINNFNIGGGNIATVTGSSNTGFGKNNLANQTSGSFNLAIGEQVLNQSTTASYQIGIGYTSLYLNNGGYNIAIGWNVLRLNESGVKNTALGYSSMFNSTGDLNTAIGYNSGSAITTGSKNVIIGSFTGFRASSAGISEYDIKTSSNNIVLSDGDENVRIYINSDGEIRLNQPNSVPTDLSNYNIGGGNIAAVTGTNNTGFGKDNLNAVTTGVANVGFGNNALKFLTEGQENTTIGYFGLQDLTTGNKNVSVGTYSLQNTTTGSNNVGIGVSALSANTTNQDNVAIGYNSGSQLSGNASLNESKGNLFLGHLSGSQMTTGSQNVIIGSFTGTTGEVPTPVYNIITSSNNIVLSDGDGNVRQSFDSNGAATFSTGANRTLIIGKDSVDTGYNVVSLNGTTTKGSYSGIAGGGTSDNNLYLNSANNVVVQTGSGFSPSLTISSNGETTISTTASNAQTALTLSTASSAASLNFSNTGTSPSNWYIQSGGGITGALRFYSNVSGSTGYRLSISSGGDATLNGYLKLGTSASQTILGDFGETNTYLINYNSGGTLKFLVGGGTASDEKLTISSGGLVTVQNGIKFGGTPSPAYHSGADTLDAYEEGTWTGTQVNDGVGLSSTGSYTRIGNTVFFKIYIGGTTTSAGLASVTGLPYSANSSNGYNIFSYVHGSSLANSRGGYISGTTLIPLTNGGTGGVDWVVGSVISMFSGTYTI